MVGLNSNIRFYSRFKRALIGRREVAVQEVAFGFGRSEFTAGIETVIRPRSDSFPLTGRLTALGLKLRSVHFHFTCGAAALPRVRHDQLTLSCQGWHHTGFKTEALKYQKTPVRTFLTVRLNDVETLKRS